MFYIIYTNLWSPPPKGWVFPRRPLWFRWFWGFSAAPAHQYLVSRPKLFHSVDQIYHRLCSLVLKEEPRRGLNKAEHGIGTAMSRTGLYWGKLHQGMWNGNWWYGRYSQIPDLCKLKKKKVQWYIVVTVGWGKHSSSSAHLLQMPCLGSKMTFHCGASLLLLFYLEIILCTEAPSL